MTGASFLVCKLKRPLQEAVFTLLTASSIKDGTNVLGRQCEMHLEEMLRKHPSAN